MDPIMVNRIAHIRQQEILEQAAQQEMQKSRHQRRSLRGLLAFIIFRQQRSSAAPSPCVIQNEQIAIPR